ncbi:CBS-domain-containing protein [Fistulina hepatica ATCC 64428]|uniref:CBS-domain-containing protein n=1 Tax=Fistulina hepatica ATCC 64428 TaxID=1128425 RepID=A0A0D7AAR2_9AGAR|nr:CBS-domain-containing protein [Fistulina hepatica ATCC 64428]
MSSSPVTSVRVRRRGSTRKRAGSHLPPRDSHESAIQAIRTFLKGRTSYDAFPVSFRLIVLDTQLNVKKALHCLLQNGTCIGVVSAPLWNSETSSFAGMLTVLDIIHLIQYYYRTDSYDYATADVETFKLESLRGENIEKELGVAPPPTLSKHPSSSLYDAATTLIHTHARRLPLVDHDTETGLEVIVSVLTQYRLLKFISINCSQEIQQLHHQLRKLGIGTYVTNPTPENPYHPIATAKLDTTVFEVVHMFSERSISAVPIIDDEGVVVNLYEHVDVMTLVRSGSYQSLDLTIKEALYQRSPDFPGVVICTASDSLGTLMQLVKTRRVHRLVVVEGEKGRLLGIITLSDVLKYMVGAAEIGGSRFPRPEPDTDAASLSSKSGVALDDGDKISASATGGCSTPELTAAESQLAVPDVRAPTEEVGTTQTAEVL